MVFPMPARLIWLGEITLTRQDCGTTDWVARRKYSYESYCGLLSSLYISVAVVLSARRVTDVGADLCLMVTGRER